MPVLSKEEWLKRLCDRDAGARASTKALFSTWWQGIVTDPALMVVPIDDHQVHRGDAVFEALRFGPGGIYLFDEHWQRLERSAASLALRSPLSKSEVVAATREAIAVSGLNDGFLRWFLSRGPGQFSANPYDSIGEQFHIAVVQAKPLPEAKLRDGVTLARSAIAVKEVPFCGIKSCNYLANVLMKKEAVDRGLDFTIGITEEGQIAEGSTENLMIVDAQGWLTQPSPDRILAGTTMARVMELAVSHVASGDLAGTRARPLSEADLLAAREVLMVGTSLDVLGAVRWEGKPIADGRPGRWARELREALLRDQRDGRRSLSLKS